MAEWGEILARTRQARGLTLEEVSETTKIGVRFLQAIEASDARRLPGGIFNRSFVRSYARCLGLDADQIVTQYVAASGEELPSRAAPPAEPKPPAPAWLSPQAVLAAAIVVVILGAGYAGYRMMAQGRAARAARVVAPPTMLAARPLARSLSLPAHEPPALRREAAPPAALPAAPPRVQAEAVTLKLSVSAPAWVKLQANHQLIFEDTLEPGPERTFQLTPPLRLVTGNAAATHVTLNGQPQPSLGGDGAIAFWHYPPAPLAPAKTEPPSTKGAASESQPDSRAAAAAPHT